MKLKISHQCVDIFSTGQILNLAFDRTPETTFHEALTAATGTWEGLEVLNYAATESTHLEGIGGRLSSALLQTWINFKPQHG